MKKRYFAALAAAAGAGAWCLHRDRKYPLRPELRFTNKLVVPGAMLNPKTAGLANRALARMALMELMLIALPGLGMHPVISRVLAGVCGSDAVASSTLTFS